MLESMAGDSLIKNARAVLKKTKLLSKDIPFWGLLADKIIIMIAECEISDKYVLAICDDQNWFEEMEVNAELEKLALNVLHKKRELEKFVTKFDSDNK